MKQLSNVQQSIKTLLTNHTWKKFSFGVSEVKQFGDDRKGLTINSLSKKVAAEWSHKYLIASILCANEWEWKVLNTTSLLFKNFNSCKELSEANPEVVKAILTKGQIDYAGKKSNYIIDTSIALIKGFKGVVPDSKEELIKFSGVGQHSAEVVLATCFGQNYCAVDTHVKKVVKRTGLIFNEEEHKEKGQLSRAIMEFGRDTCKTKTPNCSSCPINQYCNKNI